MNDETSLELEATTQKFFRGDWVFVGELPSNMSHFSSEFKAIVLGSYFDIYGGLNKCNDYSLMAESGGSYSWYPENVLTSLRMTATEREIHSRKIKFELS